MKKILLIIAAAAVLSVHQYLKRAAAAPLREPLFYFSVVCLVLFLYGCIRLGALALRYLRPGRDRAGRPVTTGRLLISGLVFLLAAFCLAAIYQGLLFHFYYPVTDRELSPDTLTTQRPGAVLDARRGLTLGPRERAALPLSLGAGERLFLSYLLSGAKNPFPVRCSVTLEGPGSEKKEILSRLIGADGADTLERSQWHEFEVWQARGREGLFRLTFESDLCPGFWRRLRSLDRLIYDALQRKKTRRAQPVALHWSPLVRGRKPDDTSPRILLFDIDTLRADHLGCYGFQGDISPAVDRLAAEGLLFETVYSQATWTLPSTVSMMTSLYVDTHQIFDQNQRILDWPFETLAEHLRRRGYLTLASVDGGFVSAEFGFATGFHRYVERGDTRSPFKHAFSRASSLLDTFQGDTFFLFLQTYMAHEYFHLTPDYMKGTTRRRPEILEKKDYARYVRDYYAGRQQTVLGREDFAFLRDLYQEGIRATDFYFHRLVSQLKTLGLYDETWIIVTSDHGEGFGEFHSRGTFRSLMHGRPPFENQSRIPLIMKFPKSWGIAPGGIIEQKVNAVDILPTILDYVGCAVPASVQGRSLKPLIERHDDGWYSPTLSGDPVCGFAFVDASGYKLLKMPALGGKPPVYELYDLEGDAGESRPMDGADTRIETLKSSLEKLQAASKKRRGDRKTVGGESISPRLKKRLEELGYIQ
jgi:arylsulfatase